MLLSFSQRLKELRKTKNLSQECLAEKLGITSQAISKWECGQSYPDIELLPIIADIFDVTIDSLFRSNGSTETISILPFPNDDKIRLIHFNGHNIVDIKESNNNYINYSPRQDENRIEVWGNCIIEGDLLLNLTCTGDVKCHNVAGNIKAGHTVTCNDVLGSIKAGEIIKYNDILKL